MKSISFKQIPWMEDPFSFYRRFCQRKPGVLLESARLSAQTGRYSIAANDPFLVLRCENGELSLRHLRSGKREKHSGSPFRLLRKLLKKYSLPDRPGWPPFAGGAVGYVGYECKNWLEPRSSSRPKPNVFPDLYFLFFDHGMVWDHEKKQTYWFGCGKQPSGLRRLTARADHEKVRKNSVSSMKLECSFTEREFERAVQKTKKYIKRGDIFQANLAQRFAFNLEKNPEEIYAALRAINPSPFFGILDAEDFSIVSGSPERLLKLRGRQMETRPIAGTRRRGKNAKEDSRLALELLLSDKERAEHVMLVDLERNDLGRVAEYGSVNVDELMALEDDSHVKHIVSNVRGTLRRGLGAVDAFSAFFPGGTITGAPKIRCMQIIEELEPVTRGPYTGSLGYFSFTGNMDFNILIRSLVLKGKRAYLHVGAGIVADSEPKKEYHETLYKAQAILSAVFGCGQVRAYFRQNGVSAV